MILFNKYSHYDVKLEKFRFGREAAAKEEK
jgi:hypothetical protein